MNNLTAEVHILLNPGGARSAIASQIPCSPSVSSPAPTMPRPEAVYERQECAMVHQSDLGVWRVRQRDSIDFHVTRCSHYSTDDSFNPTIQMSFARDAKQNDVTAAKCALHVTAAKWALHMFARQLDSMCLFICSPAVCCGCLRSFALHAAHSGFQREQSHRRRY